MNEAINVGVAAHIGTYSDAVLVPAGKQLLYISGTPGLDTDSGELPDTFAAQAELAWVNIEKTLAAAGMDVENIVKLTQHLLHRDDLPAYRDIRNQHLGDCAPASMLTILPGLVWPNMLIELEVVAAK